MIKDEWRLLYKYVYLSLYCKGSKRLFKVLWWEGFGDRTELQHFEPDSYGRQRCVSLVLRGSITGGPEAHSAGFLYHILWATSLDPNSSGDPRAPSAWCGFPYHISSITPSPTVTPTLTVWLLSWLSYIIVQRPLDRPLNLWNGMFDRHQAKITVMQSRGHSLPVHHSEVGLSPCPILSAELTCVISSHNCHWIVSLPSGASLWMAFLAGSKAKIQHYI